MDHARSLVTIGAEDLDHLFYQDRPVVTFEQIAAVHGISVKTVHNSFQEHKTRFIEGKHIFRLDFAEANKLLARQEVKVSRNGVTLFTEAGYLLLVKPMRDERSWQVQEMMIEAYFRTQSLPSSRAATLTHGEMLVQMALAYQEQEQRLQALEETQRQEQRAMIQTQKDLILLQQGVIDAKDHALLALQSMQWVTIRQYVEMFHLHHQMPAPIQRRYATWLTTYCLEHNSAMYKAATADKAWPHEKTYCIATIQLTLPGWLTRLEAQQQPTLGEEESP